MRDARTILSTIMVGIALVGLAPVDPSVAQSQSRPSTQTLPSDDQLDALLAARDWNSLGAALAPTTNANTTTKAIAWMQSRLNAGGGLFLGFFYARDLWRIGDFLKTEEPGKDMRLTAGMIVLYT